MSTTEEVKERFEWDAKNFASIYPQSGWRLSAYANRILRKAVFERYRIALEEAGAVSGKAVLDIGCGSGIYAAEFLRRGAERVVGIDFSQAMLTMARSAVGETGASERCTFLSGDFMKLDIDERFDVTLAMGVFDYLPEPLSFLKKMARVTKGKALASFPAPSGLRGNARRLRYLLTGRGDVYYYSSDRVRELADQAGFARYRIVPIEAPLSGDGTVLVGYGADDHP